MNKLHVISQQTRAWHLGLNFFCKLTQFSLIKPSQFDTVLKDTLLNFFYHRMIRTDHLVCLMEYKSRKQTDGRAMNRHK